MVVIDNVTLSAIGTLIIKYKIKAKTFDVY
jgi:hypothetical protein